MTKHKKHLWKMGLIAAASLVWLIVKTGRKPSRIVYPCQKAAIANINLFLVVMMGPMLEFFRIGRDRFHAPSLRSMGAAALVVFVLVAFEAVPLTVQLSQSNIYSPFVRLDLESQVALTPYASDLFLVQNASNPVGNTDEAFSVLLQLMENHSLFFFKTLDQPAGLIARDDVVLMKVNCQWPQRGGTNTDLVKTIIKHIVNHPEGFVGEIVVADNGQGSGNLDRTESNAFNHSQSMKDVVKMFPSNNVSIWLWDSIRSKTVGEYGQGDFRDGYIVNSTQNPVTHVKVSYPKFKTQYGTYLSFKHGIWSNATSTYDSERLKIINVPVLKSHSGYGVTACVKHYMGVPSQSLTGTHSVIGDGALATIMVEARSPVLNILDALWVNPIPMGNSGCGPSTSYGDASFTNVIGASRDPVALDYWTSKYVLIPAAIQKGYSLFSSLDPDYASGVYHRYLENSMNELKKAGFQATMNETEMNVYVLAGVPSAPPDIAVTSMATSKTVIGQGYTGTLNVTLENQGNMIETFNVTVFANSTTIHSAQVTLQIVNSTLIFKWNATGFAYGNYTLSAYAEPIPGEIETGDNNYTCALPVHVGVPGDISGPTVGIYDGSTDMRDINYTIGKFNGKPGDPKWVPNADVNDDNVINMRDIHIAILNFNRHE